MDRLHRRRGTARWPIPRALLAVAAGLTACRGDASTGPAVHAAVAGNFATAHRQLVEGFERSAGIAVRTTLGSTGQLYAAIVNGAPFDVFLAADTVRPARLETEGGGVSGTRFTYAVGRLVVYAPAWDSVDLGVLRSAGRRARVAVANPAVAPYGAAAQAALARWGLWETFAPELVRGQNVAQALQFVESGAADVGFVALGLVSNRPARSLFVIPDSLHPPLDQQAVLLRHGRDNAGARAFLAFVRGPEGRRIVTASGYGLPSP